MSNTTKTNTTRPAFAVVCEVAVYCPNTDAAMGSRTFVESRHPTRTAAQAHADKLNQEECDDFYGAKVEMRAYREGEDQVHVGPSALELHNHYRAVAADMGYAMEEARERDAETDFAAQLAAC